MRHSRVHSSSSSVASFRVPSVSAATREAGTDVCEDVASSTSEKTKAGSADGNADKPAKPGHGPRAQSLLPVADDVLDLDEADRVCNACGGAVDEWPNQFEASNVVGVLPRRFVIRHYLRKKYRCAWRGSHRDGASRAVARYSVDSQAYPEIVGEGLALIRNLYAIDEARK